MGYTSPEVKNRYNKKAYDQIFINVPKGQKDQWKEQAEKEGLSLAAYIMKKVNGE